MASRTWLIVGCAAIAAAMFACGDDSDDGGSGGSSSGSVCDQACKKLTECNPNGVTQCNITCPQNQSIAECIINAKCDDTMTCILGGSAGAAGSAGSAGAAGGGGGESCATLSSKCATCTDATVKTQCEGAAAGGQEAVCQAVLAAPQFAQACP